MPKSILTLVLSAALTGLPAIGTPSPPPSVNATVEACVASAVQTERSVTFTGQMETIPGSRRMAMEMIVQERGPGETLFHRLAAAGPAAWQRSEAGLKIYKYVRQVTDLPAPADYRAVVVYRWLGAGGRVVKRDERRTPICRQSVEPPPVRAAPPRTGARAATMPAA
jgi:hypothetical protein